MFHYSLHKDPAGTVVGWTWFQESSSRDSVDTVKVKERAVETAWTR